MGKEKDRNAGRNYRKEGRKNSRRYGMNEWIYEGMKREREGERVLTDKEKKTKWNRDGEAEKEKGRGRNGQTR